MEKPLMMAASKPITIFVVEDEILIRMSAAEALREAGFTVIEAATADEALALLQSGVVPDGIFTDINMPGAFNGLALARRLKAEAPAMTVLVTSANTLGQDEQVENFLLKPYDVDWVVEWFTKRLQMLEEVNDP